MEVKNEPQDIIDVNEHGFELSEKAKEDLRLVNEAREGNQQAYAQLLERYQKPMFHMVCRMVKNVHDAEDITMDSFGKAFRNLANYKPERAFSTWLFKIASNKVIDFIRSKRLKLVSIDEEAETDDGMATIPSVPELVENSDDPEERMIHTQRVDYLEQFVAHLHKDYREIIVMRFFKDKSYVEIAEELGLPMGTVKARIYRSRELLEAMFLNRKKGEQNFLQGDNLTINETDGEGEKIFS